MNASKSPRRKLARQGIRRRFVAASSRRLALEPLEQRTLLSFGDLDSGFGREGRLVTDFPGPSADYIKAVAQQTDGKIIAVGASSSQAIVARYTTEGGLDPTFGAGGIVRTWLDQGNGVAILPDGRILIGGTIKSVNLDMAVMRYLADGQIDTTFGSGGITTLDFGADDSTYGMAIGSDGKIVVAGTIWSTDYDIGIARLNADGSFDASFGADGLVHPVDPSHNQRTFGVAVDSAGRILIATTPPDTNSDFAVERFLVSGALDTSFGSGGLARGNFGGYEFPLTMALQADGRILVGGQIGNDFGLARFNTDGSIDGGFGSGGKVTTNFDVVDNINALSIQADGRIVAAGQCRPSTANTSWFAVARYLANGSPDTSFDGDGKILTACDNSYSTASACLITSDGKIVAAGSSFSGTTSNDLALVRYHSDGSLDTAFGGDGKVTTNVGGPGADSAKAIARQTDRKLVVAGTNAADFALARYLTNGEIDPSFGSGGRVTTDFGGRADDGRDVAIQSDGKTGPALTNGLFR
jgi:uncharacterized delta-60 repeat protein